MGIWQIKVFLSLPQLLSLCFFNSVPAIVGTAETSNVGRDHHAWDFRVGGILGGSGGLTK